MMRLAPSGDVLGRIARRLAEGRIRPDIAKVYALRDAAQEWKDIAENLPGLMDCRTERRERQEPSHTARSCFVWPSIRRRRKTWPKEFLSYFSVTFKKFLERVTLRSAAIEELYSTVCCMSPQVSLLGTMPR